MSERLNLTINPTEQEWEAMETPFRRQGAKDPLISELREVLYAGPAWIGKARDGGGIAADRLQEIIDAAEAKADTLDHLPEGEPRQEAPRGVELRPRRARCAPGRRTPPAQRRHRLTGAGTDNDHGKEARRR